MDPSVEELKKQEERHQIERAREYKENRIQALRCNMYYRYEMMCMDNRTILSQQDHIEKISINMSNSPYDYTTSHQYMIDASQRLMQAKMTKEKNVWEFRGDPYRDGNSASYTGMHSHHMMMQRPPKYGPPLSEREHAVFISYETKQGKALAECLTRAMEKEYGIQVFFSDTSARLGDDINYEMCKALHEYALFIPLMSTSYFTSSYCLLEAAYAYSSEMKIIPVWLSQDVQQLLKEHLYLYRTTQTNIKACDCRGVNDNNTIVRKVVEGCSHLLSQHVH